MSRLELDAQTTMTADTLKQMPNEVLVAQELTQQGAVHALSYLLKSGCSEAVAAEMLAQLRNQSLLLQAEVKRRGRLPLFAQDQTKFN